MNTASIRSDWTGRLIDGRFPLLKWLGGSERSDVYLTELQGPGSQKVAIRLIPVDSADDRAAGWTAATALSHPRLMRLFATGRCEIDGSKLLYSVTEYAEEVLSEIIPERALTPNETKEMLVPILDALFYLHGKGFVHGHLKPSNIMVVGNQLKLTVDSLEIAGELRKHEVPLSVYDAPELSTRRISPSADVWSLGAMLVTALTQNPPVWDRSKKEPAVPGSIPQPFARMVRECLRLDPAHRCTLSEVNKARFEDARSVPASSATLASDTTGPARLRVAALIAAALLLLAVIAILHLRSHRAGSARQTRQQQHAATVAKPQPAHAVAKPSASIAASAPSQVVSAPARGVSAPARVSAPPARGAAANGATLNGAVAKRVLPEVSQGASATIRGTVRVRIRVAVDAGGNVANATFDSTGPSRYFANLALQAAQGWKFKPANVNGTAIGSVWMVEFDFTQTGVEVAPVEVAP